MHLIYLAFNQIVYVVLLYLLKTHQPWVKNIKSQELSENIKQIQCHYSLFSLLSSHASMATLHFLLSFFFLICQFSFYSNHTHKRYCLACASTYQQLFKWTWLKEVQDVRTLWTESCFKCCLTVRWAKNLHGENVHVQRLSASVSAVKQTSWKLY